MASRLLNTFANSDYIPGASNFVAATAIAVVALLIWWNNHLYMKLHTSCAWAIAVMRAHTLYAWHIADLFLDILRFYITCIQDFRSQYFLRNFNYSVLQLNNPNKIHECEGWKQNQESFNFFAIRKTNSNIGMEILETDQSLHRGIGTRKNNMIQERICRIRTNKK